MAISNVRSYTRSRAPRMKWTTDHHRYFVQVVEELGGKKKATPKNILKSMGGRGLTISHVKSHLQMYRNRKEEPSEQERREIMERQTQQYHQIYERAREVTTAIQNQERLHRDIHDKINAFLASSDITVEVGLSENGDDDIVVAGDVSMGEEELSLELTLGLKY